MQDQNQDLGQTLVSKFKLKSITFKQPIFEVREAILILFIFKNHLELEREYYYSEYGEEYDEGDPDYYDDDYDDTSYNDRGKYNFY